MYSHIVPQAFDDKIIDLETDKKLAEGDKEKVGYIQDKIDILERALEILNEDNNS